jgi:hypothetical protein
MHSHDSSHTAAQTTTRRFTSPASPSNPRSPLPSPVVLSEEIPPCVYRMTITRRAQGQVFFERNTLSPNPPDPLCHISQSSRGEVDCDTFDAFLPLLAGAEVKRAEQRYLCARFAQCESKPRRDAYDLEKNRQFKERPIRQRCDLLVCKTRITAHSDLCLACQLFSWHISPQQTTP